MSEDELILTHILQCKQSDLLVQKPELTKEQQRQFDEFKSRRTNGEPLQYILGSWEFYGLEFKTDARALVPRPETEMLVETAIKHFEGRDVLDLGTGTGNIAVTLAKELPYAQVTAVDISLDALSLASENIQKHGVEPRVELVYANMSDYLALCPQQFDLIISNPPYIKKSDMSVLPLDVKQEPALALDGGEDGLDFYRMIIKYSPSLLRKGGWLMMEFGDGQQEAILGLMRADVSLSKIEILRDLAGKERIIIAVKA